MRRTPLSLQLHRQLGVWLGAFLLVMAVTGSALAFRPELSRALYPAVFASQACEPRLPLSEVAGKAAASETSMDLFYVEDLQAPCVNAFAVVVPRDSQSDGPTMLGLDLATGEIAGRMPLGANVLNLALVIHTTLLAGNVGRWVVVLLGIVCAALAWTGVLVWARGQARRLGQHLKRTYRVRPKFLAYDAHRATGITTAFFLLFMAITGTSMAFEQALQPLVERLAAALPKPDPTVHLPRDNVTIGALGIPEALALSERLLPDARPAAAGFAGEQGELVYVRSRAAADDYGYGRIVVFFDRNGGPPLAVIDRRTDSASWFIPLETAWTLHTGRVLGLPGRLLSLIAGVSLTALFLLSLRLWWKRRQRARRAPRGAAKAAKPAARRT